MATGTWEYGVTFSAWIMGLTWITPAIWQQMQGSRQLPSRSVTFWQTTASATAAKAKTMISRSVTTRKRRFFRQPLNINLL